MPSRWTANWVAILAGTVLPLVVACSGNQGARPAGEVAALRDCPPPQCVPRRQVAEQLGFPVYEPHNLPEGYSLYSRTVRTPRVGQTPPGTDASRATPGEMPTLVAGSMPAILLLEYRFNQSINVPAILISESIQAPAGLALRLRLAADSCGEVIEGERGALAYFNGPVEIEEGEAEGELLACKVEESPQRDFHTVLLTKGNVLIEVAAFPEAGISKDEVLDLAGSFTEAE